MFWLLMLWLVPIAAAMLARRVDPPHVWRDTGIALGLVVSPASLGLYSLYFVGPIAAVFGIVGLVLVLIHGAPGYSLATTMRLVTPGISENAIDLWPEIFNAAIWSVGYGAIGWLADRWTLRRNAIRPG